MIWDVHPGFRIPDPRSRFFSILDPGSRAPKSIPSPIYGSATLAGTLQTKRKKFVLKKGGKTAPNSLPFCLLFMLWHRHILQLVAAESCLRALVTGHSIQPCSIRQVPILPSGGGGGEGGRRMGDYWREAKDLFYCRCYQWTTGFRLTVL
jgi:hypothetical protein